MSKDVVPKTDLRSTTIGQSYKTFYTRKLRLYRQFSCQYDFWVVIYKRKVFIRLATDEWIVVWGSKVDQE